MAKVKPFKGLRPPIEMVERVISRPYDVLNSDEARKEAEGNEQSLYRITRAEIDFPSGTGEHEDKVYHRSVENFKLFQKKGWLKQDAKECYYIYAQTMNGKTQYGLVVGASVEDYLKGIIKKHELTRRDKEKDRMRHVLENNANIEPVFIAYHDSDQLDYIVQHYIQGKPEYDFVTLDDNIRHLFWVIENQEDIDQITQAFADIPYLYIADGHHRSAAAALVGSEKAHQNPNHTGEESYNYFMAVCYPASQLTIMDYNRVVKDLNGLTKEEFLSALEVEFKVTKMGEESYHPEKKHYFGLYIEGEWYRLIANSTTYDENNPLAVLDANIVSDFILDKILNIKDLRSDERVDFVGGIRGLQELERRVDCGEMKLALALYPVSMEQLMNIADTGNIMPPKSTWFEPKPRSGLVIHKLD
ncbi:MAG: DUF1015 domain-containing protein [Bacteroidales bacterium]|nr:DUF1015 domain-containing protein [Bacteroidales bacterium]